jgi:pimeloyl-ACP methyl ester carboxylesterase
VHLVRPDIDLELWVSDLVNVLEFEDLHGVILTAWGFGGMVITPAADRVPDRVSRLVYINAYVPRAGQATIHLYPPAWLDLVDEAHGLHQAGGAWLLPPPDADYLRDFVPDDARRHWFAGKLTAHPMRTVTQPVRLENAALASIPRTYLHCLKGAYGPLGPHIALIQPWFEALPGWEFRDVPLTYFAPVNDPLGVAAELERLVSVAVGDRA